MADQNKSAKTSFDVIIVGGGPVGLSLAGCLAKFGPELDIALCDQRPIAVPTNDARASALAAGVTRIFESLGIWNEMAAAATPITRMKITDSGHGDIARPLFLSFEGDVAPGRPYAHMVPNTATIAALIKAAAQKVHFLAPVQIKDFATNANHATLTLADGAQVTASLVVAADGARSALRQKAGIGVLGHDYGQMGIVTTIAHELDHAGTAYEHFRPAGPFASLPLPNRQSSLVWTESAEAAKRYLAMSPDELAPIIESVMGASLGAVEIVDKVQAFPLRLQIAREFVGNRLALIGDAAHVIHPISGQGLNLGLKDVAALSEVIIEAARLGRDIGAADVLQDYQAWRRFDTALTAMVTDGLNRLFANDIAPVRALRDFGLGVVDRLPLVKAGLIRQAAGMSGPKLLRGQTL